jgi:hypothetical protein
MAETTNTQPSGETARDADPMELARTLANSPSAWSAIS